MEFLNALFNYTLIFVCMSGIVVAAVVSGKKLRDMKDNSKK